MNPLENTMASSTSTRAIVELEMGPIKRSKSDKEQTPEALN